MKKLLLTAGITVLLTSCVSAGSSSLGERALLACSAWADVFRTVTSRRAAGLATEREIETVNLARPFLVPFCSSGDFSGTTAENLEAIEIILLQALTASRKESHGGSGS